MVKIIKLSGSPPKTFNGRAYFDYGSFTTKKEADDKAKRYRTRMYVRVVRDGGLYTVYGRDKKPYTTEDAERAERNILEAERIMRAELEARRKRGR